MLEKLIRIDENLFLWLNSFHSDFWDRIMWLVSGKYEWLPLYLILAGIIIYRFRWKSIPIILAALITIILTDQLAVKAFKMVIQRIRPSHNPDFEGIIHLVNGYRGGLYSFVSNHAANSFGLASFLVLVLRNKYATGGLIFWAMLVSYSRIYLGVHYPGDILGGAILGAGIGCMMYFMLEKFLAGGLWQRLKEKRL